MLALRSRLRPLGWRGFAEGGIEAAVTSKLTEALGASNCVVEDRSGGCGQSFNIQIESEKFRGQTKLKCQRMVQARHQRAVASGWRFLGFMCRWLQSQEHSWLMGRTRAERNGGYYSWKQ
ncbi:unnamed protein product [Effrenium voratum]|nr:unnamed protein product [Effrenium voratum]CAJ1414562.1 unnamed protein product [Effrenium voratum]